MEISFSNGFKFTAFTPIKGSLDMNLIEVSPSSRERLHEILEKEKFGTRIVIGSTSKFPKPFHNQLF